MPAPTPETNNTIPLLSTPSTNSSPSENKYAAAPASTPPVVPNRDKWATIAHNATLLGFNRATSCDCNATDSITSRNPCWVKADIKTESCGTDLLCNWGETIGTIISPDVIHGIWRAIAQTPATIAGCVGYFSGACTDAKVKIENTSYCKSNDEAAPASQANSNSEIRPAI